MAATKQNIIYSSDPGLVIGFHGCDQSVRDAVLNGYAELKPSNNNWDWLGDGIYFWQNNYERALEFAINPPGGKKNPRPAVLGAVFSLGHCLDLIDKQWIDFTSEFFQNFKSITERKNILLPKNLTPINDRGNQRDRLLRYLDCAVIKFMHKPRGENKIYTPQLPFESVRAAFIEGEPIYENAGFYSKTHIQVCIRNHNLIRGFFLPRYETPWNP